METSGRALTAVRRAQTRLEAQLGRPPTVDEVGVAVGLAPEKVADVLDHAAPPVSLNSSLGDEGSELGDHVADQGSAQPFEDAIAAMVPTTLDRLLGTLDDRDREVLCLRLGLAGDQPCSLAEVGRRLGVSGERIRQIERRAIARLKPELARLEAQGLSGD